MKLLADLPAVDVEEPPHRPALAILGGASVLVIMLAVGLALVLSGGGEGDGPPGGSEIPAAAEAQDPEATIDLESWTTEVGAACRAAASEHPVLRHPDEAPVAELDTAVRALTSSVREIPLPTAEDPRASALNVVARGDEAEQAWDGIAVQEREEVSRAELNHATGSTKAFVSALIDLGAECNIFFD